MPSFPEINFDCADVSISFSVVMIVLSQKSKMKTLYRKYHSTSRSWMTLELCTEPVNSYSGPVYEHALMVKEQRTHCNPDGAD